MAHFPLVLAFLSAAVVAARVELNKKTIEAIALLDPDNPTLLPCLRQDPHPEECVNERDSSFLLASNISVCDRPIASTKVNHVEMCLNAVRVQPELFQSVYPCGSGFLEDYKVFRRSPLRGGTIEKGLPMQPLQSVAQMHAKEMAKWKHAGHAVLGGRGLLERVQESGWTGFPVGGNIAQGMENLKDVVRTWMCSPSNRQNLMSCAFDTMGIGLSSTKSSEHFLSVSFGCTAENGKCQCGKVKILKELPKQEESDKFLTADDEIVEQSQEIPEVSIDEPQIAADPENPVLASCVQNTTIECLNTRDTIVPQSADINVHVDCPDTPLAVPGFEFKQITNQIEQCINAYRVAPNVFEAYLPCAYTFRDEVSFPPRTPLRTTPESDGTASHPLDLSATGHSQDMASNNYFEHNSLDGRRFSDRILAQGWTGYPMAENIAAGYQTVRATVLGWVCSAGHRKNLMSCGFDIMGTGVGFNSASEYKLYYTQNFGCSDPSGECKCGQIVNELPSTIQEQSVPESSIVDTDPTPPSSPVIGFPAPSPDQPLPPIPSEPPSPAPDGDDVDEVKTLQDLFDYLSASREYTGLLQRSDLAGIFRRSGISSDNDTIRQYLPEIEDTADPYIIGDPLIKLKPNTTVPPRCLENPDETCRTTPVHRIALVDPNLMCDPHNITESSSDEIKIAEKVELCVNAYRTDPDAFSHMLPCDYDFRAEVTRPQRGPLRRPTTMTKQTAHPLVSFAVDHSFDMAMDQLPVHFGHDGSDGKTLADRITEANITMFPLGELISAGKQSVQSIVMGWVCSTAHRQLLMSCGFDSFGTGVSIDPFAPLRAYVTQAYACSEPDGQCKCKDEIPAARQGSCAAVSSALPVEEAMMPKSPLRFLNNTRGKISMNPLNAAPHSYDCVATTIAQNITIGVLMDSPSNLTKQDFNLAFNSDQSYSVHLEAVDPTDTQNWVLTVRFQEDFSGFMNVTMISSNPPQVLQIKKLTKSEMIEGLREISDGNRTCL